LSTNDEYKIDKFRVQLKDGSGNLKNFADAAPNWRFRLAGIKVLQATDLLNNTTINGTGFTEVTRNRPNAIDDHHLGNRQMAGYYFTGDGLWTDASNWNNVTTSNQNTLPGPNSNAIINGNLTVPDGVEASLLPSGGNGGELTVLTGSEPLYTLTVSTNFPAVLFVRIRENAPNSTWLTAQLNTATISLPANYVVRLYTYDLIGDYSFVNWTSTGGSFTSNIQSGAVFTMPASNVTATANWAFSKSGFSSSQVGIDELNRNLENEGDAVYSDVSSIGNFKDGYRSLWSSLTIVPGSSLTVDKLYNDNSNGAAAILVKSDATGTGYLIHNNSGVAATVERYLSQTFYHYVSSPISNATNFLLQGTLGVDDFWEWDEVGNLWNNLNAAGVNSSDALNVAQGYAVAYKNSEETKSFVGTLNTGDITFPATFTNTWMQKGYNFVGNPYASAISADEFIEESQNLTLLEGGLYFWDETLNYDGVRWDYATYTLLGGTGTFAGGAGHVPNGFIAPSQGFMVKVTAAGDVNFNNDMREIDEAPFFKSGEEISRAWLSVTGPEGDYNEILAGFIEQGQTGIDITDAVKLKGNDKLAFYMQLEGNDYVIQGLPVFDQSKSYAFPLGIDAGFTGAYTFKMREIENFDSQVMFTLEDKLNGTFFDLRGNTEYVAQIVDAGEIRDRFVMHINGVTAVPEVAKQLTKVYATNNQIVIELVGNNKILDVEVLNTLGQTITKTQVNATNATLNINGSNVVYIVRVRTNQGVESHKILLH
jgi:hypothetical protein